MKLDTKSKVSLTTFRPKDHGMAAYKDKPLTLGIIIGVAQGESRKRNVSPSGEVGPDFVGLMGNFRCMLGNSVENAVKGGVGVQSGICYLPEAWLNPILALLSDGAKTVEFAHEVKIGKRGEDGYEWILTPLTEPSAADPLNAILEKTVGHLAIEDHSEPAIPPAGIKGGKTA